MSPLVVTAWINEATPNWKLFVNLGFGANAGSRTWYLMHWAVEVIFANEVSRRCSDRPRQVTLALNETSSPALSYEPSPETA